MTGVLLHPNSKCKIYSEALISHEDSQQIVFNNIPYIEPCIDNILISLHRKHILSRKFPFSQEDFFYILSLKFIFSSSHSIKTQVF